MDELNNAPVTPATPPAVEKKHVLGLALAISLVVFLGLVGSLFAYWQLTKPSGISSNSFDFSNSTTTDVVLPSELAKQNAEVYTTSTTQTPQNAPQESQGVTVSNYQSSVDEDGSVSSTANLVVNISPLSSNKLQFTVRLGLPVASLKEYTFRFEPMGDYGVVYGGNASGEHELLVVTNAGASTTQQAIYNLEFARDPSINKDEFERICSSVITSVGGDNATTTMFDAISTRNQNYLNEKYGSSSMEASFYCGLGRYMKIGDVLIARYPGSKEPDVVIADLSSIRLVIGD